LSLEACGLKLVAWGSYPRSGPQRLRPVRLKPDSNCLPVHQGLASIEGSLIRISRRQFKTSFNSPASWPPLLLIPGPFSR